MARTRCGDEVILLKLSPGHGRICPHQDRRQGPLHLQTRRRRSLRTWSAPFTRTSPTIAWPLPEPLRSSSRSTTSGKNIDGVSVVADIMRIQAQPKASSRSSANSAVQNASKPPRTQMDERNLEFYIPNGAQIIEIPHPPLPKTATRLNPLLCPKARKTAIPLSFRYGRDSRASKSLTSSPIAAALISIPNRVYPLDHFGVMMPKAMQFTAAEHRCRLQIGHLPERARGDPCKSLPTSARPEPRLQDFRRRHVERLSGGGGRRRDKSNRNRTQRGRSTATSRPGGGLGPPIDAPDPLQKYRWPILGSLAAASDFRRRLRSPAPTIRGPRSGPPVARFFRCQ